MLGAMRYHAPALDTESTWKKPPQQNCATPVSHLYFISRTTPMCDDGLTHRPIIDGNQKKRCPTRISGKRLVPCLPREFLFLFRGFLSACIHMRARALASASIGQVGKYYNDSLTVENPHDTPLHDGSLPREKRQR